MFWLHWKLVVCLGLGVLVVEGVRIDVRNNRLPEKEVFIFSTTNANYKLYDWTKITTIVECGYHDDDLVTFAHSKNVTVSFIGNFATSILTNATAIDLWIAGQVKDAVDWKLDGINVDYEDEIGLDDPVARAGLTALVQRLTARLKSAIPHAQVTMDFAWSPNCIDNRCYDYQTLADVVDFAFIMDYDTRSQIPGDCVAWANSPTNLTLAGLKGYTQLGIPANKIVLGVPWYGYDYPCVDYDPKTYLCKIKPVPFRGSPCSDASGKERGYSTLMHLMNASSTTGRLWDKASQTPYFAYPGADGAVHQVWFDDAESLPLKYAMAASLGLRGVGMWEADSLDYSDTPEMRKYLADMWNALP